MSQAPSDSTKIKSDELGYLLLGIVMVLAGIRALLTGQLASPLWYISGSQAYISGILCLVLGGILLVHSLRKRARRADARQAEAELKRSNQAMQRTPTRRSPEISHD